MPSDGPATAASPRADRLALPGWFDTRLVLGVLLVLLSVVAGARLLSSADRTDLVWAAGGDLAPGAVLDGQDLVPVEVRLDGVARDYLDATAPPPVGFVVARGLLAGELVPQRALQDPARAEYRQVTVDVRSGDAPPDLRPGQLVDVYLTPSRDALAAAPPPPEGDDGRDDEAPEGDAGAREPAPAEASATRRVLQRVAVASVPDATGFAAGADTRQVVLNVLPADVLLLVQASASGALDLVRLPVDGLARREPVQAAG